ncbi:hypothetical protein FGG08_007581, partial [Glutinoglossum americanum]
MRKYYAINRAFSSPGGGNMHDLVQMMLEVGTRCRDVNLLGTFSENHDMPRFAHHTWDLALTLGIKTKLAKNVITFTILADGIPIIYQGQEQHLNGGSDPHNREALWLTNYATNSPLYQHISLLNRLRRHAIFQSSGAYSRTRSMVLYTDRSTLVMQKGEVVTVLSKRGLSGRRLEARVMGFVAGGVLIDVLRCAIELVDAGGGLKLVDEGLPK